MLRKLSRTVVIPGVAAVTARPASIACAVSPPPASDPAAPPISNSGSAPPLTNGDRIYLYVPRYFGVYTNEETRTASVFPAPAGYTCARATYLVADPAFPGGFSPVYETRCYWNYP